MHYIQTINSNVHCGCIFRECLVPQTEEKHIHFPSLLILPFVSRCRPNLIYWVVQHCVGVIEQQYPSLKLFVGSNALLIAQHTIFCGLSQQFEVISLSHVKQWQWVFSSASIFMVRWWNAVSDFKLFHIVSCPSHVARWTGSTHGFFRRTDLWCSNLLMVRWKGKLVCCPQENGPEHLWHGPLCDGCVTGSEHL